MFKAKIKKVKQDKELETKKDFLDVELELSDGKTIAIRKLSFPIDSSDLQIKAEVKKYVETFNLDSTQAVESKKNEERDKRIKKTIKSLEGEIL